MGLIIKDNIVEIKDTSNNLKFSTNRLLSSIIFRQSGTINVTDFNYQAPIIVKEHPAIVDDPEKFFMFISLNIYGGDINSQAETINGSGSVLLAAYKDNDGYLSGSMILDFQSTPGILYAKITKHVIGGAKIDYTGQNFADGPNIWINYAIQYCRFASSIVPQVEPLERFTANLLLVGGGGGGGGGSHGVGGGGGGAGEFKEISSTLEVQRTYDIYVGYGGAGGGNLRTDGHGVRGEHTRFYNYTALGGGGGGNGSSGGYYPGQGGSGAFGSGSGGSGGDQYWADGGAGSNPSLRVFYSFLVTDNANAPTLAGSSGGSTNIELKDYYSSIAGTILNPAVPAGRTNAGGRGIWMNGGGGGGAGSAGVDAQIPISKDRFNLYDNFGGLGGSGYPSNITGTSQIYAAGGSGGTSGGARGISVDSIGGEGGSTYAPIGGNAVINTGSGGGGKGTTTIVNEIISGWVKSSGTTLMGTTASGGVLSTLIRTAFTVDLSVNDVILVDNQQRTITAVTDNFTATVDKPFDPPITTPSLLANLTRGAGFVGGNGASGVFVLKIPNTYTANFTDGVVYQHITSVSGYNIYKVTETKTIYETVTIVK